MMSRFRISRSSAVNYIRKARSAPGFICRPKTAEHKGWIASSSLEVVERRIIAGGFRRIRAKKDRLDPVAFIDGAFIGADRDEVIAEHERLRGLTNRALGVTDEPDVPLSEQRERALLGHLHRWAESRYQPRPATKRTDW